MADCDVVLLRVVTVLVDRVVVEYGVESRTHLHARQPLLLIFGTLISPALQWQYSSGDRQRLPVVVTVSDSVAVVVDLVEEVVVGVGALAHLHAL